MAIAGPAGTVFGIAAVFVAAGIAPTFLALAAIAVPRLDLDELAHPLDHPTNVDTTPDRRDSPRKD